MKRYALVGASGRALGMFAEPLINELKDCADVVGIFDTNPIRMEAFKRHIGLNCPSYTDFDQMLAETKPDTGIVTTVDSTHHDYIIRCLEAGVDAISEKPMTIDAEKCQAIMETEKRTGRDVKVTFNMRYIPYTAAVKKLIMDGAVGDVLNINFDYRITLLHGADYFRRWHRQRKNSGGLPVHKSTHHFDLINWWLDQEPVEVMAFGARSYFGDNRREHGERCLTCKHADTCELKLDIMSDPMMKMLYADAESADGYLRDRCVFDTEIDIEDTIAATVRYSKGALASYSLVAYSPFAGYHASINGTDGRMEIGEFFSGYRSEEPEQYIEVHDRKGNMERHVVKKVEGTHSGGDYRLRDMLFRGDIPDPLGQQAGSYEGALSLLIGAAANKSIAEGGSVKINDLVRLADYRK